MRDTYLSILYNLAVGDENVVSLVADNGMIVYDNFRKDFPDRYFNFGISEGNMVAAAAGMASCGKIPFVYTISSFLAYRSYEFIRNDVCYQNQNVKIVGIGAGLTYSTLGPTHHTTEDIGLLRGLPNLVVFSPATKSELKWVMRKAYEIKGPVYIRLGNNKEDFYKENVEFTLGNPSMVKRGKDVTIFFTGTIINEVMKAVSMLAGDGIDAQVVSIYTLKPLNALNIIDIIMSTQKIVVVEEHNIISGLFSAIAEIMADNEIIVPNLKIGLEDSFAIDYGHIESVRKANGLDGNSLYKKIKKFCTSSGRDNM